MSQDPSSTPAGSAVLPRGANLLRADLAGGCLRQAYDGAGRFEQAGAFFRRGMTMRRMLLPILSMDRLWSKVVDTFCAYGESPPRVIVSATRINLVVAIIFWLVGISGPDIGINREDGRV